MLIKMRKLQTQVADRIKILILKLEVKYDKMITNNLDVAINIIRFPRNLFFGQNRN